jgi:hypothetical protein
MYAPYNPQSSGYLDQLDDEDDEEEEISQPYVKYRKIDEPATDSSAAAIARHYNQILDKGIKGRQRSRVYPFM